VYPMVATSMSYSGIHKATHLVRRGFGGAVTTKALFNHCWFNQD
jgi:hypothetical protein